MRIDFRNVGVRPAGDDYAVLLEGRPLNTPARAPLALPSHALAEAVAAEWRAQEHKVRPETMPLTRLAATAIDRVPKRRAGIVAQVAAYAGSDLLCYRAEAPPELVARQMGAWQPLLDWAAERYGVTLEVTTGILPVEQPQATLAVYAEVVASHDDMRLAALQAATAACGSLVLALALAAGRLDPDEAFELSQLDESFLIDRWGEDTEVSERRAAIRADIEAAHRFLCLCGD